MACHGSGKHSTACRGHASILGDVCWVVTCLGSCRMAYHSGNTGRSHRGRTSFSEDVRLGVICLEAARSASKASSALSSPLYNYIGDVKKKNDR